MQNDRQKTGLGMSRRKGERGRCDKTYTGFLGDDLAGSAGVKAQGT